MSEVISSFQNAAGYDPLNLAGAFMVFCIGVGGILVVTWILATGKGAFSGQVAKFPAALLTVIVAFFFLIIVVSIFYK